MSFINNTLNYAHKYGCESWGTDKAFTGQFTCFATALKAIDKNTSINVIGITGDDERELIDSAVDALVLQLANTFTCIAMYEPTSLEDEPTKAAIIEGLHIIVQCKRKVTFLYSVRREYRPIIKKLCPETYGEL